MSVLHQTTIKILFIISDLAGGGAERVVSTILTNLDRSVFSPELCLWRDDIVYPLPDDIPRYMIGKTRPWHLPKAVLGMRRIIKLHEPDVVCSHLSYVNALTGLSLWGLHRKPRWIACEHSNPGLSLPRPTKRALGLFLKRADRIIGVSRGVRNALITELSVPESRVVTMYNPLDLPQTPRSLKESGRLKSDPPVIAAMGSLNEAKDYPTMLRALSFLLEKMPVRLKILGDGPLRSELESLAGRLGVSGHVEFLGFVRDPFPVISSSDAYLMSSRWEGLPTALIEAMACGIPVVSTRAPYGPEEIIIHGECGLLVDVGDARGIADSLYTILNDLHLRAHFIETGLERVHSMFSRDKLMHDLQDLFLETVTTGTGDTNL